MNLCMTSQAVYSIYLNKFELISSILGDVYQNNTKENSITLLLGTDGKPTFKSSRASMWPVSNLL